MKEAPVKFDSAVRGRVDPCLKPIKPTFLSAAEAEIAHNKMNMYRQHCSYSEARAETRISIDDEARKGIL